MNRLNQPDFAPGQSMNDPFGSDPFSSGSGGFGSDPFSSGGGSDPFSSGGGGFGSDPFGGGGGFGNDPFGGGFGSDPFGSGGGDPFAMNGFGGMNMQNGQQGQQPQTDEEKFWDAAGKAGKGTVNFVKDITASFGQVTPLYWTNYGATVTKISVVVIVLGIIGKMFGLSCGLNISIGACLALAVGICCWLLPMEKAKTCTDKYKDGALPTQDNSTPQVDNSNSFGSDFGSDFGVSDFSSDFGSSSNDDFGSFGDDSDDSYTESEEDDEDWDSYSNDEPEVQADEGMSAEDALSQFQTIDKGMYTRQYLYETFTKVLPTVKPDFDRTTDVDEDSDEFLYWGEKLREAAEVAGCKEDFLPELSSVKKNIFTFILTCDRPTGFKSDAVTKELANIYAYQDGEMNDKVYATYVNVGKNCIITIFNGTTESITIKDTYTQIEKFVLDSKNYIPVVLGVDQMGKVICCDFKKIESCIIAGMPRSGKSWTVQSVITQMCAYVPPTELNFYIIDPKADTSDFKSFTLPHVKKFACRYTQETGNVVNPDKPKILDTLDYIVNKEAPRRKKMIGDSGCVNIWDFRTKNPDVALPLLYVIIDEAVTLAEDMNKEDKSIYQSYVTQVITQFPNLGIRAFLIPHVVKNDIIKKTATDSMKCRISVNGSPEHIESSTGTKAKDFKYKLSHVGDMAVYMPDISRNTMFVHSAILSTSNEKNNEIFDYLRRVWNKLEPNETVGSVAVVGQEIADQKELLAEVNSLDNADDIIDFDDVSSDVSETSSVFTNTNDDGLSSFDDKSSAFTNAFDDDDAFDNLLD
jgi:S-DNA-T family DNA segregation ATPase FtsK/SpoIIIE